MVCLSRTTGSGLHELDPTWRFRRHLSHLEASGHTWRHIYWHVWGVLCALFCVRCGQCVSAAGVLTGRCKAAGDGSSHEVCATLLRLA